MQAENLDCVAPVSSLPSHLVEWIDKVVDRVNTQYNPEKTPNLLRHLEAGKAQLETYLAQTYDYASKHSSSTRLDYTSFVLAYTEDWKTHFQTVEKEKQYQAIHRTYLKGKTSLLSTGEAIEGYDIKVNSRGCPDDRIYEKSAYARENLPRGNFLGRFYAHDLQEFVYFPLLRAYPKFTGHEDDGEVNGCHAGAELVLKYYTRPLSSVQSVISTRKQNGEAAHLAIFKRLDNSFVYVVGSKNVHAALTDLEDIETLAVIGKSPDPKDSFMVARSIARALMQVLLAMTEEKRLLFCDFLAYTRLTANFEILCPDHQHIELFNHLTQDTPVLFGFSFPLLREHFTKLELSSLATCMNPLLGYELAKDAGCLATEYRIYENISIESLMQHQQRTYLTHNTTEEGRVFLLADEEYGIIGLQKFKTAWYVCLRAIREKAKRMMMDVGKRKEESVDVIQHKIEQSLHKRFQSIQTYLDISKHLNVYYRDMGKAFISYLTTRVRSKGKKDPLVKEYQDRLANMFPVVWQEFLDETHQSEAFQAQIALFK